MEDNNTLTTVDETLFFWPHEKPVVWYEVIGTDVALPLLEKKIGRASDEGYYRTYKHVIDCYFKPGTYSPELADVLNIPESLRLQLVHHTYRDQQQHHSDGDDTCSGRIKESDGHE